MRAYYMRKTLCEWGAPIQYPNCPPPPQVPPMRTLDEIGGKGQLLNTDHKLSFCYLEAIGGV